LKGDVQVWGQSTASTRRQELRILQKRSRTPLGPGAIDLEEDRKNLVEMADDVEWLDTEEETENSTTVLRSALAMFGAGEEEVTEDLAPLAVVFDDVQDQMFITTQMYEEAKRNTPTSSTGTGARS